MVTWTVTVVSMSVMLLHIAISQQCLDLISNVNQAKYVFPIGIIALGIDATKPRTTNYGVIVDEIYRIAIVFRMRFV
jgi:hypothetical protein